MEDLYRIGVIGTKRPQRRYISMDGEDVKITGRDDALHWNKFTAKLIAKELDREFAALKRAERFQVERAT